MLFPGAAARQRPPENRRGPAVSFGLRVVRLLGQCKCHRVCAAFAKRSSSETWQGRRNSAELLALEHERAGCLEPLDARCLSLFPFRNGFPPEEHVLLMALFPPKMVVLLKPLVFLVVHVNLQELVSNLCHPRNQICHPPAANAASRRGLLTHLKLPPFRKGRRQIMARFVMFLKTQRSPPQNGGFSLTSLKIPAKRAFFQPTDTVRRRPQSSARRSTRPGICPGPGWPGTRF